jgi:hypothetical protein
MKVLNKKVKKIDCILFYDEVDMLLFRLTELDEFVDYFVILESDIDFKLNQKKFNYRDNIELFEKWKNKIIYLPSTDITKNSVDLVLRKNKFREFNKSESSTLTKDDILYFQTAELYKFLMSFNLSPDDIILFSDVDEIPNLENFDSVISQLTFEPVVLKQQNFLWSIDYCDPTPHMGTCCFQFSSLIQLPNKIYQTHFTKNNRIFQESAIIENGFHFAHFYSLEKTIHKLELISDKDLGTITKNTTDCFENLISIFEYYYEKPCGLIEYIGALPKNYLMLPSQKIGREQSKKYDISIDFENNDTDSILFSHLKVEIVSKSDTHKFLVAVPSTQYYDVLINENNIKNFQKMYGINELKKILISFYPLNKDLFEFHHKGNTLLMPWQELKDEFIYDKIKSII